MGGRDLVRHGDGGEWRLRLRGDDRAAESDSGAGDEHEGLDQEAHDDRPNRESGFEDRAAVAPRRRAGRNIPPRASLEDERDRKRRGEAAPPARGGRVAAAAERQSLGLVLTILASQHTTIFLNLKFTTGIALIFAQP